jgi:hypothetical protein
MTTGNTTLLGLALQVEGELDGTWGDVVNDSITSLVDSAVAGTTTLSTDEDVTLTTTVLAANQARQAIIRWTASNGATTRNITAPAQSKPYIVLNAGTGSIVLRGAGPTTGITVVAGEYCVAAWSGADFVKVASSAISDPTGILPVINGGTGTATPALVAGTGILVSGTWPAQTIAAVDPAGVAVTYTAKQTFAGTSSNLAEVLTNAAEPVTLVASAATGTINFDVTTQSVLYYTVGATANWTLNFRASAGTTLNAVMSAGQSVTAVFMATQGATAYYNNALTIDGTAVTPKWQGNTQPDSGNASGIDVYAYVLIKTADATFTVLASQTQFA